MDTQGLDLVSALPACLLLSPDQQGLPREGSAITAKQAAAVLDDGKAQVEPPASRKQMQTAQEIAWKTPERVWFQPFYSRQAFQDCVYRTRQA